MAQKNKDVKFIRRNGRVIPIRKKDANKALIKRPGAPPAPRPKKRESKFKAAGFLGAGALASLFGGSVLAEFGKEAAHSKDASIGLFKRGRGIKKQAESIAAGAKPDDKDIAFLKKQAKAFTRAGAKQRGRAAALTKHGTKFGGASVTIGATLIGMGLHKAYSELVGRSTTDVEDFLAYAAGVTATSVAAFEFGKKTGVSAKVARRFIAPLVRR